jgi:hypothetical protein
MAMSNNAKEAVSNVDTKSLKREQRAIKKKTHSAMARCF